MTGVPGGVKAKHPSSCFAGSHVTFLSHMVLLSGFLFWVYFLCMPALIKCPICGRENDFFENPTGPFCSARCKLVDLGKWLGEDYRISEPLRPDHLEAYEHLSGEGLDQPEEEL
jgi:endogenous inhibitor of DNA gyrase (YacG/DUF329 family)